MPKTLLFIIVVLSSTFCNIGLAHAERVVSLSANGEIRILASPACTGPSCTWVTIDSNPRSRAVAATDNQLFQIHNNGEIWLWLGRPCTRDAGRLSCSSWSKIDVNPQSTAIVGNESDLFQLHRSGAIWRWRGSPCVGNTCSSWERLDRNSNTRAIVAADTRLFQMHANGSIWHWQGRACTGDACNSWTMVDNNPGTREIDVSQSGQLFQRHDNGSIWAWGGRPCTRDSCPSWTKLDENAQTVDIIASKSSLLKRHGDGSVWRHLINAERNCIGPLSPDCPSWSRIGKSGPWVAIAAGPRNRPTGEFGDVVEIPQQVYAVSYTGAVSRWPNIDCSATCPVWTPIGNAFATFDRTLARLYIFAGEQPTLSYAASSVDTDFDGIPDEWERRGRGPLTPDMVRVGRRDVIMYVIRRGGISEADVRTTMESVRAFYRRLPITNPDGSSGIWMTVVYGPEIPSAYWDSSAFPYNGPILNSFRRREWVGVARILVFETPVNQGGQSSVGGEWAGAGRPWQAVAHEIGHQLGLGHTPPTQPTGGTSPLWPSIMNYMYNYSLGGSGDAVQFSTGEFVTSPLNEVRLSELLPFPIDRLRFLGEDPHRFRIESRGAAQTGVDWNRNGTIETGLVAADINDGNAVEGKVPALVPDRASGAPALAVVGERLVVVYPKLSSGPASWDAVDHSTDPTNRFYASVLLPDGSFSSARAITLPGARNGPSATGFGDRLAVASVIDRVGSVELYALEPNRVGARTSITLDRSERMDQIALASGPSADLTGQALYSVAWDRGSGSVKIGTIETTGSRLSGISYSPVTTPDSVLTSAGPVGAAVDPLSGHLLIVYHDRASPVIDEAFLRIARLQKDGSRWSLVDLRWVGGAGPFARSTHTPSITLDPTAPIAGKSQVSVYALTPPPPLPAYANTIKYKEVADRTQNDGWRNTMMIDQWNNSQSATAAVRFGSSDAFALRWKYQDPRPNLLVIYTATGVFDLVLRDHNDVQYIANVGVQQTIKNLRCIDETAGRLSFELTPRECP